MGQGFNVAKSGIYMLLFGLQMRSPPLSRFAAWNHDRGSNHVMVSDIGNHFRI